MERLAVEPDDGAPGRVELPGQLRGVGEDAVVAAQEEGAHLEGVGVAGDAVLLPPQLVHGRRRKTLARGARVGWGGAGRAGPTARAAGRGGGRGGGGGGGGGGG